MKRILTFFILLCFCPLLFAGQGYLPQGPTVAYTEAADVTAPEVSTATIGTNGTSLTLAMSETVTRSGGTFDVDCSTAGSDLTATYSSGSGSSSLVYTVGTTVNSGDTCNLDYNGAANGVEDGAGNDLASITDKSITNNSTQGGGGYATPAYVGISDAVYDGTYNTNTSYSATTGNVVALVVTGGPAQTVTGVTANAGTASLSSWTSIASSATDSSAQINVLWASVTSGGTVQVRPTGSASDAGYCVLEISGIDTTAPLVGSATYGYAGGSGGTSAPTDAVTVTIANSFAIAIWASEDADSTITWGNGGASPDYTMRQNTNTHYHKVGTKVCNPTGNYTFSPTWTGTNKAETVLVILKPKAL